MRSESFRGVAISTWLRLHSQYSRRRNQSSRLDNGRQMSRGPGASPGRDTGPALGL
jgi:hypothetical protein